MSPGDKIRIVEDPRFQGHRGPDGHPERPERLVAVGRVLREFEDATLPLAARAASAEEIHRVHRESHWRHLAGASGGGLAQLDPDTYCDSDSFEVARLAAGSAIDLALSVATGDGSFGLAAVRPPGHHAESDRAMGFCLFNNVAVAARALQAEAGLDKILILDWDVHHGNGTQHTFEEDPSVLYISTHQYPYYPGTGDASEAGVGRGEGATVNIPMPAGCGDREYVGAFRRIAVPVARAFAPEMILVSCGFDAHCDDPLAAMEVTGAGYRALTDIVRALAEELCEGRLAFVLEGGYSATSLMEGTRAVLAGLTAETVEINEQPDELAPGEPLRAIVEQVAAVHRNRYPDLGTT